MLLTPSKVQPFLLKQPLNNQKQFKDLESMHENAIYTCIF